MPDELSRGGRMPSTVTAAAAKKYDAFFDVHSRTEPGWWPMKIPFKSRDTKIHQLRYLTPELLDLLTHPGYAPPAGVLGLPT